MSGGGARGGGGGPWVLICRRRADEMVGGGLASRSLSTEVSFVIVSLSLLEKKVWKVGGGREGCKRGRHQIQRSVPGPSRLTDRPPGGGVGPPVDKVLARKSSTPSHHHHHQQPPTTSLDCAGGAICGRPAGWEVGEETRRRRGAAERWQVFFFFPFSFLSAFDGTRFVQTVSLVTRGAGGRGGGKTRVIRLRGRNRRKSSKKKKKNYSTFPNIIFFFYSSEHRRCTFFRLLKRKKKKKMRLQLPGSHELQPLHCDGPLLPLFHTTLPICDVI